MDRFPSEILVPIFRNLYSNEMVKMKRVCKRWFDIVEANKDLWRRLILPERKVAFDEPDEWIPSWPLDILDLFIEKSECSLKEISMRTGFGGGGRPMPNDWSSCDWLEVNFLRPVLKSKDSVQYIHIFTENSVEEFSSYSELSWRLPNLVDCIIEVDFESPVKLKFQSQPSNTSPGLRSLWIFCAQDYLKAGMHLVDSIASLHVQEACTSQKWRRILEEPAKNLKDLRIKIEPSFDGDGEDLPVLDFPGLRTLSLGFVETVFNRHESYQSWMKIPPSSTFIDSGEILPTSLPSVSGLWITISRALHDLPLRCPVLAELRLYPLEDYEYLLSILLARRENVKAGKTVDRVKMKTLKRLVVDFQHYNAHQLGELRELVKELVDLNTVKNFIRVEI